MSRKTPEALRGQARTLADAATAAARWFRRPEPAALSAARTARLRARGWREESVVALKGGRGAAKAGAADFSFAVGEAVESAVRSVSDAALWGLAADAGLAVAAEALRDAAKALVRAAEGAGPERAAALIEAKRWAAVAERGRREEARAARESTFFIDGVKRAEVAGSLSSAAESLQQACDALAGSLAE
jgi:hypothetical protein